MEIAPDREINGILTPEEKSLVYELNDMYERKITRKKINSLAKYGSAMPSRIAK
jgi:hypothetical protein